MLSLAVLFATASASARELTPSDFDDVVFNSGKGAFVKFLAPWWGHCKKMKPDWDKLGAQYNSGDIVTIVDVDCTAKGEPLCQRFGVRGYPTVKYFTEKTGKSGADYSGGRSFNDMKSFVDKTFKLPCDAKTKKGCNEQELRYLEKIAGKSKDELKKELEDKKAEMKTLKDNRSAAEKEYAENTKTWKKKETALQKAIAILKQLEKKGGKEGKDEL